MGTRLAQPTAAAEIHSVGDQLEAKPASDLDLQPLNLRIYKLHHPTAHCAYDVVVVILVPNNLEPRNSVAKINRCDQPGIQKQLQSSIGCSIPYCGHFNRCSRKHVIETKVAGPAEYHVQQNSALPSRLKRVPSAVGPPLSAQVSRLHASLHCEGVQRMKLDNDHRSVITRTDARLKQPRIPARSVPVELCVLPGNLGDRIPISNKLPDHAGRVHQVAAVEGTLAIANNTVSQPNKLTTLTFRRANAPVNHQGGDQVPEQQRTLRTVAAQPPTNLTMPHNTS